MPLSIEARRQQSKTEVSRLLTEFGAWRDDIHLPQYTTQLESISSEVLGCAQRLGSALDGIAGPGTGAFYSACLKIEKQVAWLWRAWDYFREKFDQRRDVRYGDTLRAADEVIWSCYRPFFKQPLADRVPDPAPLPFIEMEYSPAAVRRDQSGVIGARPDDREFIDQAFEDLPVPVMKLPVSIVRNPWAIALVGHETGHFIQRMISQNPLDFVGRFRDAVENAAGIEDWGSWAVEIFADWYSVLTMGQWSLHPIAQFGAGNAKQNAERGGVYPSFLTRLSLMAVLCDSYGIAGTKTRESFAIEKPNPGEDVDFDADIKAVPAVAQAIRDMPECREIAARIAVRPDNYVPGGLALQWSKHIAAAAAAPPTGKPDSARLVAAGAVAAWDSSVFGATLNGGPAPSEEAVAGLRDRTVKAMVGAAMPGVRASSKKAIPARKAPGEALFALLEKAAQETT